MGVRASGREAWRRQEEGDALRKSGVGGGGSEQGRTTMRRRIQRWQRAWKYKRLLGSRWAEETPGRFFEEDDLDVSLVAMFLYITSEGPSGCAAEAAAASAASDPAAILAWGGRDLQESGSRGRKANRQKRKSTEVDT